MNKNYQIAYNIAWTLIPILLLFGNSKESRDNTLVWLGVTVWIIFNAFLIYRKIKKTDAKEAIVQSKSKETIKDCSNIVETFEIDLPEFIKPLNNGELVVEQIIDNGWRNVHNAFCYRHDNVMNMMTFLATSRGKNGVLFTWAFSNYKPTDVTILIQAFPFTNSDEFDKILSHFLQSYSKKMQCDHSKDKLSIKHWDGFDHEWMRFSFKTPQKQTHHLDVLVMSKNNYMHMIVYESIIGDQMKQLLVFLPFSYKN